jgi:hypothetical protein
MGTSQVKMLVPNLVKHGILVCKNKISGAIVFKLELLSHIGIWIHDLVVDLQTACLNSKVLIKQAFIVLIDAKRGDQVDISVNHDKAINLTILIGRS